MNRVFTGKQVWQFVFSCAVILSMLIPGSAAYADETQPGTVEATETTAAAGVTVPVATQTVESPTAPAVEAAGETVAANSDSELQPTSTETVEQTPTPDDEVTPTPDPVLPETDLEPTEVVEDTVNPPSPADAETVSGVIEYLQENEIVLTNSEGDALPLASTDVEAALSYPDPWIIRGADTYRFLPVGGCAAYGGVGEFCTETSTPIQAAVNFALAGETVYIGSGVFVETVDIDKDLTLQGEAGTVIQAPSGTGSVAVDFTSLGGTNLRPVIYISNGAFVHIDSLTVDGNNVGNGNYSLVGIGFCNAGGEITNSTITNIQDNPASGNQSGVAIYAANKDGVARTITINGNTINNFQKNGMALTGEGLTVNVTNNTVTGKGEINYNAQNGIQVSSGATGTIANNTITGFDYTKPGDYWNDGAAAILLYNAGNGVTVSGNQILNSDNAIYVYNSDNATVTGNTVNNNLYGIVLYDTNNAALSNNVLLNNRTAAVALWDAYNTSLSGDRIDGNSSGTSNNGSSGIYAGNTVSGLQINGVTITDTYKGINVDDGTSAANWLIQNSTFNGNGYGAFFQGNMNILNILNSQFNDNATGVMGASDGVGLYAASHGATASRIFNNVYISGSQFNGNSYKGIYLEKANDLMINQVIAQNNGWNGLDINLKGANYQNIYVGNSVFANNGLNTTQTSPANIWVKARNDAAYAAYPATLTNLTLDNLNIYGGPAGVIIGNAAGDSTGVTNAQLRLSRLVDFTSGYGLINRSLQQVIASSNWWGCNTGPNTAGCSNTQDLSSEGNPTALVIPSYLQLGLSASPASITNQAPDNTSQLAVLMTTNLSAEPLQGSLYWFTSPAVSLLSGPGSLSGSTFTAGNAGITTFSTSYDYSGAVNANVETIAVVVPGGDDNSDDEPAIVIPVVPGEIIPVTGGMVPLSCAVANLLELPDGRQLVFYDVLCQYAAGFQDEPFDTLPDELSEKFPADASFHSGVTVSLVKGDEVFFDLPAGVGAAVRFPITREQTEKKLGLLRWDPFARNGEGEWVAVDGSLIEQVTEDKFFFTTPIYKTGTYAMTME